MLLQRCGDLIKKRLHLQVIKVGDELVASGHLVCGVVRKSFQGGEELGEVSDAVSSGQPAELPEVAAVGEEEGRWHPGTAVIEGYGVG